MSRVMGHMVDAVVLDSCSFTGLCNTLVLDLVSAASCGASVCVLSFVLTPSVSGGTCIWLSRRYLNL